MMARRTVLMAAALLVGGVTACSDLTGTNARADGNYYLQTVNNVTIPFTYTDNTTGHSLTVTNDIYAVNTNGTYNDQQLYRDNTINSSLSYTESGTWSQSNSTVTFYPNQSSTGNLTVYTATVGNSNVFGGAKTLTINFSGTTWFYSE
jgi:hypothetical protein